MLTARILTSAQLNKPITFATWNNPFDHLRNCSFTNIICKPTSLSTTASGKKKAVELWPNYHWPKYGPRDFNVREFWNFVTIHPSESLEIRHRVPQEKIDTARMESGEKYGVEMTDLGLGTSWWMYGAIDDVQDKNFMRWSKRGVEGRKRWLLDNVNVSKEGMTDETHEDGEEWVMAEKPTEDMWGDSGDWIMGEDPAELALVIEEGAAEFEVL